MFINARKAQAVRRPVTTRDFLDYAMTLGHVIVALNVLVLLAVLAVGLFVATNDTFRARLSEFRADDTRLMHLDHVPENISADCYMTLIKRLQSTTDVRTDGTVEVSEVVWTSPASRCSDSSDFQ